MNELDKLLKRIDEVVTLPIVVQETIDAAQDPDMDATKLAGIISKDPILAVKIMRTANSSLFGFLFKTTNLENAVARLGIRQVKSIAAAMGVGKLFKGGVCKSGYSRIGVWEHSVAVGVMNEVLIKVCRIRGAKQFAGEALVAGLIHDIGIILEEQYLESIFPDIPLAMKESGHGMHVVESRKLGFNHAELGAAILKRWRLPSSVVEAVAFHHHPFEAKDNLLATFTAMSEILTATQSIGFSDLCTASRKEFGRLQSRLGLMGTKIVKARALFDQQITEALEVFSVTDQAAGPEKAKIRDAALAKQADPADPPSKGGGDAARPSQRIQGEVPVQRTRASKKVALPTRTALPGRGVKAGQKEGIAGKAAVKGSVRRPSH